MRLRVTDHRGQPPSLGRSVARFFGLLLAIVPLFAGFIPVLIDDRRRGLQDFLAGTTVLYVDREPLISLRPQRQRMVVPQQPAKPSLRAEREASHRALQKSSIVRSG